MPLFIYLCPSPLIILLVRVLNLNWSQLFIVKQTLFNQATQHSLSFHFQLLQVTHVNLIYLSYILVYFKLIIINKLTNAKIYLTPDLTISHFCICQVLQLLRHFGVISSLHVC